MKQEPDKDIQQKHLTYLPKINYARRKKSIKKYLQRFRS